MRRWQKTISTVRPQNRTVYPQKSDRVMPLPPPQLPAAPWLCADGAYRVIIILTDVLRNRARAARCGAKNRADLRTGDARRNPSRDYVDRGDVRPGDLLTSLSAEGTCRRCYQTRPLLREESCRAYVSLSSRLPVLPILSPRYPLEIRNRRVEVHNLLDLGQKKSYPLYNLLVGVSA